MMPMCRWTIRMEPTLVALASVAPMTPAPAQSGPAASVQTLPETPFRYLFGFRTPVADGDLFEGIDPFRVGDLHQVGDPGHDRGPGWLGDLASAQAQATVSAATACPVIPGTAHGEFMPQCSNSRNPANTRVATSRANHPEILAFGGSTVQGGTLRDSVTRISLGGRRRSSLGATSGWGRGAGGRASR